jgi:hypothetical protein
MQSRRAQWAEQVRQWRQSGLTARDFAKRVGINAGTLSHWAWRLGRPEGVNNGGHRQLKRGRASSPSFVELVAGAIEDRRFELEFSDGRRLRIPAGFDGAGLERLLAVLDRPGR